MGQLNKSTVEIQEVLNEQLDGDESVNVGWDDIVTSLIGRRLYSNTGTVDYNYAENSITFQDGGDITDFNDTIVFNMQKPHGMSEDGVFKFHIHWWQEFSGQMSPEFTYRYRIQDNGAVKTTTWTTVSVTSSTANEAFDRPTSGVINQITKLGDIDVSSVGISATVQVQFTRSDSDSNDVEATFLDSHYPTDQERGSRQEFVK